MPNLKTRHSERSEESRSSGKLAFLLALGIAPFYVNGWYNARLIAGGSHFWFWIVEILVWIVVPCLIFWIGYARGLFALEDLGFSTMVRHRRWIFLVCMVIVPYLFWRIDVWTAPWAFENLPQGWPRPRFSYAVVIPAQNSDTQVMRLLALLHLCITAGVVEEFYYRAAFARLFPRGLVASFVYVFGSSVVFAGAHWEGGIPNVAEAFVVGVFASIVFCVTRNIWPLIVGHIITDWYWFSGGFG